LTASVQSSQLVKATECYVDSNGYQPSDLIPINRRRKGVRGP